MYETTFGVETKSLTDALRDMERDRAVLRRRRFHRPLTAKKVGEWSAKQFHDYLQKQLTVWPTDKAFTEKARRTDPERMRTTYGKALIAAANIPNLSTFYHASICVESEPRMIRSLMKHTPSTIRNKGYADYPAVILLGADDIPVGYQKNSGTNAAYIWDGTAIDTRAGRQAVPDDCWAFAVYPGDMEIELLDSTAGLVAIRANEDTVENFGMAQPSAANYAPVVRTAAANAAAELVQKLNETAIEAASFVPTDIRDKVGQLLTGCQVEIIG